MPLHIAGGVTANLPWYNIIVPIEAGMKGENFNFAMGFGAGYSMANTGEINVYLGLPITDEVRQLGLGFEAGYKLSSAQKIKANFSYELTKIENILNIALSFYY